MLAGVTSSISSISSVSCPFSSSLPFASLGSASAARSVLMTRNSCSSSPTFDRARPPVSSATVNPARDGCRFSPGPLDYGMTGSGPYGAAGLPSPQGGAAMKFMLMGRDDTSAADPAQRERRIARHQQIGQELVAQRGLVGGSGLVMLSATLSPEAGATTLRIEGGKPRIIVESLAERRQNLTSIDVIDFGAREEAVDFAKKAFAHDGHATEIRSVHEMWFTYHGSGRGDAPKFAILFLNDERMIAALPAAEVDRSVTRHAQVGWQYSAEKGLLRGETFSFAGVRLRPSAEGTSHRIEGGRHLTSDGPFAETKELVGGLQLVDCACGQEAVEWAEKLAVRDGEVMEIRAVESLWWIYHG
jgi:hypothetical protein